MSPQKQAYKLFMDMAMNQVWGSEDNSTKDQKVRANQCALVCVAEITKEIPMYTGELNPRWKFWNDVKNELEKL